MFRFIRQLVQKLNKDKKVETQHPSSHSNGNTFVVGSQSQRFCYDNNEKSYFQKTTHYGTDLSTKGQ